MTLDSLPTPVANPKTVVSTSGSLISSLLGCKKLPEMVFLPLNSSLVFDGAPNDDRWAIEGSGIGWLLPGGGGVGFIWTSKNVPTANHLSAQCCWSIRGPGTDINK
jgi:hypothetical protein